MSDISVNDISKLKSLYYDFKSLQRTWDGISDREVRHEVDEAIVNCFVTLKKHLSEEEWKSLTQPTYPTTKPEKRKLWYRDINGFYKKIRVHNMEPEDIIREFALFHVIGPVVKTKFLPKIISFYWEGFPSVRFISMERKLTEAFHKLVAKGEITFEQRKPLQFNIKDKFERKI